MCLNVKMMIVHFSDLQLGSSNDYLFNEGWI